MKIPCFYQHSQRRGFSLMEVLITIAIIAALAALAFPMLKSGITAAHRTNAINQLRQVGSLAVAYAVENNNILPDEGGEGLQSFSALRTQTLAWYNVLPPMAGLKNGIDYRTDPAGFYRNESMFFIKAAKYPKQKLNSAFFAYGINSQLVTEDRPKVRLTDIPEPSRTALFAEAALPDEKHLLPVGGAADSLGQPKVRDKRFVGRYKGTGVIAFADGHAEVVQVSRANSWSKPAVLWEIP